MIKFPKSFIQVVSHNNRNNVYCQPTRLKVENITVILAIKIFGEILAFYS